jgi:uncharacterized protein (TIGR02246 family)
MRRSQIPILACIFFSLAIAFAQPFASAQAAEADKAAINNVLHSQETAWNKGDIDGFMKGYKDSPETTFIGKTIRYGYQPILERYKTAYATPDAMGKLTFSDFDIRMLGPDHAVVVGKFHLARNASGGGDASGIYSLILEREPEGWRIILDHTSTN